MTTDTDIDPHSPELDSPPTILERGREMETLDMYVARVRYRVYTIVYRDPSTERLNSALAWTDRRADELFDSALQIDPDAQLFDSMLEWTPVPDEVMDRRMHRAGHDRIRKKRMPRTELPDPRPRDERRTALTSTNAHGQQTVDPLSGDHRPVTPADALRGD